MDKYNIDGDSKLYKSYNNNLYIVNKYGNVLMLDIGSQAWVIPPNAATLPKLDNFKLMTYLGTLNCLCAALATELKAR